MNSDAHKGLPESANPWPLLATVLAFGVSLRVWLAASTDFTIGDAFIGFRFAEQFAAGNGLVFNEGECVGGNTSVLYSLLLGLGACTGMSIPLFARILGVACDVGALFILWNILRGRHGTTLASAQVAVPAMIFLSPFLFFYSVSGMETSYYMLVSLFFLDRTLRGLDWVWHLAVALVFFSRPDGLVLVCAALLFTTIVKRRIPWVALAGTFLIGLVYLGFNHLVYGSVIPLTVKVKAVYFHNTMADNFQYVADRFFFHQQWVLALYIVLLIAVTLIRRNRQPVLLFGLAAVGYLLFVLSAPYLRTWYLVPFLTLSAFTILVAVATFAEGIKLPSLDRLGLGVLAIYVIVACYAYRLVFRECSVWRGRIRDEQEAAGTWLRNNSSPDVKVFVTALETGYFSKRHTWDYPGLVTPQLLEVAKSKQPMGLLDIADYLRVEYAMIPDEERTNSHPHFRLVRSFGTERSATHMGLGKNSYSIFQRVDVGSLPAEK